MKIAVMGTGGMGGYYGALLARQGEEVSLVARGAHLETIRKNGLTIKSIHGDFISNPVKATDNPAEKGPVERDPRIEALIEQSRILDQHFEGCRDIGVTCSLRAGKGTGKAPQIRNMRGDGLRYRHQASFA